MKQGLKRPTRTLLIHGLLIALTVFWSLRDIPEAVQWILRVMGAFTAFSLVHMIMRRNYFEVENNQLIIQEAFFKTKAIGLDKIEKIEVVSGWFAPPKIILKDKTVINYSAGQVNEGELKEFMGKFGIPVG